MVIRSPNNFLPESNSYQKMNMEVTLRNNIISDGYSNVDKILLKDNSETQGYLWNRHIKNITH